MTMAFCYEIMLGDVAARGAPGAKYQCAVRCLPNRARRGNMAAEGVLPRRRNGDQPRTRYAKIIKCLLFFLNKILVKVAKREGQALS